jgi:hypothetical protein
MSAASAKIVANADDTIQVTFTPQSNGFASMDGVSLTLQSSGDITELTVASNQTSYKLPKDDSFIQVSIDQPDLENGTLAYTVNGGQSVELWNNRPLVNMPGAFTQFGR